MRDFTFYLVLLYVEENWVKVTWMGMRQLPQQQKLSFAIFPSKNLKIRIPAQTAEYYHFELPP